MTVWFPEQIQLNKPVNIRADPPKQTHQREDDEESEYELASSSIIGSPNVTSTTVPSSPTLPPSPPPGLPDWLLPPGVAPRRGRSATNALLTVNGPTYKQAIKIPEWKEAMETELQKFKDFNAFELVDHSDIPKGTQILNSFFINVVKVNDATGETTYKSRLVINGKNQSADTYDKTFASTPSMTSFKLLIAAAIMRDMKTKHVDWTAAFLNAEANGLVIVKPPAGFAKAGEENKLWRLTKAGYGTKDAAYRWEIHRDKYLLDKGFERCPFDPCVFIKVVNEAKIYIKVHTDDAPIFYEPDAEEGVNQFLNELQTDYKIRIQETLQTHLGMRITRGRNWIALDQQKYASTIVEQYLENKQLKRRTPWDKNYDSDFDKTLNRMMGI